METPSARHSSASKLDMHRVPACHKPARGSARSHLHKIWCLETGVEVVNVYYF